MLNRKGQSVLEYTLLLAVVVAALVFVLLGNGDNSIKNKVQNAYTATGDALEETTGKLTSDVFGD